MRRTEPRPRCHGWAAIPRDRSGRGVVEYIILVGCIAIVALGSWRLFGQAVMRMANREAHDVETLNSECVYCDNGSGGPASGVGSVATSRTMVPSANPGGGRVVPPSIGPHPSSSGSHTPAPAVPPWINDILKVMCPQDKAFLQQLKNSGVTVTAYNRIYFEDPYYDGTSWTTKHFEAGGTTSGTHIDMIRSSADENAATIFHEGVHTGQPASMAWRDKEYDAYTKEEAWRISHGLPPHDPSFRTVDAAGHAVPNVAAIHSFVDKEYPGVTAAPAGGSGPPDRIVGKTSSGNTILERPDGSTYNRAPKAGDSFPAPNSIKDPPSGIPVDLSKLQCP